MTYGPNLLPALVGVSVYYDFLINDDKYMMRASKATFQRKKFTSELSECNQNT